MGERCTMRGGLVVLATAAAALSCTRANPFYCADEPNGVCLDATAGSDAGVDAAAPPCGSDADCASDVGDPVCDTAIGTCVACTASEVGACGSDTPTCGSDVCVACGSNADCPGADDVCLASGGCAGSDRVLYAAPNGTGNACSPALPCLYVTAVDTLEASSTTKNVISLAPGMYTSTGISFTTDVEIVGAGAVIQGDGQSDPVILVNAGTTRVSFVTVTNSNNNDGVQCIPNAGSSASVEVFRATIVGNNQLGVETTNCTSTKVQRSTIAQNGNGGVSISGGTFELVNNFVVLNGTVPGAGNPAVLLSPSAGGNLFRFNTVAYNTTTMNTVHSPGVTCLGSGVGLVLDETITTANSDTTSNPVQQKNCSVATGTTYSAVGNQNDNDLGFVAISGSAFDFHLTATSPSSVLNVPDNVCTGIDFDGDTRPQQVYCDFGADEFRPGQP
jgi:hypothetical protein